MLMQVYFINRKDFTAKNGKMYHVLTTCSSSGAIYEFFFDTAAVSVPPCRLFDPLELEVSVEPYGKGTRLVLQSVTVKEKGGE